MKYLVLFILLLSSCRVNKFKEEERLKPNTQIYHFPHDYQDSFESDTTHLLVEQQEKFHL